jgi:hypothetical protein
MFVGNSPIAAAAVSVTAATRRNMNEGRRKDDTAGIDCGDEILYFQSSTMFR